MKCTIRYAYHLFTSDRARLIASCDEATQLLLKTVFPSKKVALKAMRAAGLLHPKSGWMVCEGTTPML